MNAQMITVTFPDGTKRPYPKNVTGLEIATGISPGLAKESLAVEVNGELWDLTRPLDQDTTLRIITRKDADALDIIRHDTAHLLAEAAKELFPEVQVTIGPSIENGFYYDFFREKSFTPEDLEKLEIRMKEIVDRDEAITREVWSRDKAITFFEGLGETYKAELIRDLPGTETITVYRQGDFVDLCRGPHAPSTKKIGKSFKLTKLAGAYWRGDSNNVMLQRIYGTAWATDKQLKEYLHRLEEAEKRDHRRLGKEMDLFHFQEEAPGAVFWHPKGWTIYLQLQKYIRAKIAQYDYQEINTPMILDRKLWEKSGHWEKFYEHMYVAETEDERIYALKPMNCPGHVQVYNQGIKSYRDLPYKLAEFGCCHRYEPSGALHGLMRVRAMVQDDAHIFCTEDQVMDEARKFCELLLEVYRDLGFDDVSVKFADRPEKRAGEDHVWDKAEVGLKEAIDATKIPYTLNAGEGAFYGPKLEFYIKDAIGREWQCGTLQLDFILPERLNATYVGEDGQKHRPVMLHRAVLGTFERFMGIMIEHYAGKFPLWLAPTQVVVTTITSDNDAYAEKVAQALKSVGLRVETDLRNEKISYKIREHSLKKVPYILTVGAREAENETVAIRQLGSKAQETLALSATIDKLVKSAEWPLKESFSD